MYSVESCKYQIKLRIIPNESCVKLFDLSIIYFLYIERQIIDIRDQKLRIFQCEEKNNMFILMLPCEKLGIVKKLRIFSNDYCDPTIVKSFELLYCVVDDEKC